MKRRISTCLFALSTAVIACSASDPDRSERSPHEPSEVVPKPGPKGLNGTCSVTQASALGPVSGRDVVATSSGVFLAKQRALFRASTSTAVLSPLASFPEGKGPDSIAALGDTLFASISTECDQYSCTKNRIVTSADQGATWTDLPGIPSELMIGVELHANDLFLLATDVTGAMATYDFENEVWTHLHPDPLDDAPGGHMVTSYVGFDGGSIIANDVYGGGVVELPPYATKWQRLEGLSEWGYAGFASRDTVKVTSNMSGIFATIDGVWTKTFEYQNGGLSIVDAGDGFFAANEQGTLLSSADGVAWKIVESHPESAFYAQSILSKNGNTLVWLGPGLQLSTDAGNTWQELQTNTDDLHPVYALGDSLFVKDPNQWQSWNDGKWSPAFDDATFVSFGTDGVYTCGQYDVTCAFHPNGAATPEKTTALNEDKDVRGIFATSSGMFMTTMEEWNWDCDWAERSGIAKLDFASGTLTEMANGLPYADTGACRVYWLVERLVEVNDVLFASLVDDFDTLAKATYRSDDAGASWTRVGDDALVTAVDDGRGIVAWFAEGGLQRSTDAGATFSVIAAPPGDGSITDLVALNGQLVVSLSSNHEAIVFTAKEDGAWTKLDLSKQAVGPVQDLDVENGKLWLGTSTSGAWQLTSGCIR